jgi:type I restriction enzyme S subunit
MQAVFRSESTGLGNGTMGFLRLYSESFLSLPYPFPEPSEQRAIVSFLREELDRMNDVIVKIQCLIAKLREKRTALISAAVTGKIRVSEDRDCAGRCDG